MSGRSNACSELTKFWLEARHGFTVTEGVPVVVPRGLSDLDIVAIQPALKTIKLPDGRSIGPRLVIETKDEHDWDPTGREFGKLLKSDASLLAGGPFIPGAAPGSVKFSMLRQAHFDTASTIFGTADFDRLFVVHAIDSAVLTEHDALFARHRIHWMTVPELVCDLLGWYRSHPRPSGLRHSMTGDIWHLLVGFCGFDLP